MFIVDAYDNNKGGFWRAFCKQNISFGAKC